MNIDLSAIGMVKGKQYESIITTADLNNIKNTAPIGVICRGKDKIMCRIFKGSKTLANIIDRREFTVNITHNPLLFTNSLVNKNYNPKLNEDNGIIDIECYFKCEVSDLIDAVKKSDPVRSESEAIVVKADVTKMVINENINAYNRAFSCIIELLINNVSDDTFKELTRVVKKVGSKNEKQVIDIIKSIDDRNSNFNV